MPKSFTKRFFAAILSLLFTCIAQLTFAQNASTVNVGGTSSTQNITNNVATVVDPLLIIASDGDITGFTVQITGSYTAGDVLAYTGSVPQNITPVAFNTTSKSLQFTGTTSAANWQAFLRTVTLKTASGNCNPEQRQVSFIVGLKLYNPLNGHFYERSATQTSWTTGFTNAANSSYFGRQGYMVTITSTAENSLVNSIIQTDTWLGASDNVNYVNTAVGFAKYSQQGSSSGTSSTGSEGMWHWVTGPEKGTQFSSGNGSPVTAANQYANWNGGEPNGNNGGENFGQMLSGGRWNDLNGSQNLYTILEYGGMSTDNTSSSVVFTRNIMVAGTALGTITGGNAAVCSGTNSTTLTLTGLAATGTVAKWQSSSDNFLNNSVDIANTSTTLTVNNISQNTYYRAVVNVSATGCTNAVTSSTLITVNAAVPGNIVADNNTICNGASVNFTLNGYSGSIVKWQVSTSSTFANNITDITNTTPALSYQLSTAGNYYFRAVLFSCANSVNTTPYTITVINGSAPVGGAVNSISYCGGSNSGSLSLTGSTGNVSKWQYSTDGGIVWTDVSNTTTTQIYSAITATRQYRAVLTNGSCGTALSAAGVITVNPASVAGTVSGTTSVCAGTNSTTLSLGGNIGSIQWQSSTNNSSFTDIAGEIGANYIATNLTATTYYRAVVTNASCTPATSNTVTVTVKQPSTSTTNASICAGGSYSFGGSSYTTAGTYLVHLTNAVGCDSAATLNLTVNALPSTPTITPSGATTFCAGGSVTLTSDAATSYAWNGGATTQAITVTTAGTYTVTVSDGTCTATSAPVTVTVNTVATPTITAGGATTFCAGSSVTLTASAATGYSWSNGATTQAITALTGGAYTVTVTGSNGCTAVSAATTVTANALPTVTITPSTTATTCSGTSLTLTASGANTYLWNSVGNSVPLDNISTAPALAVGLRKLKASYTGNAVRIRRATDNVEQDFGFTGTDLNTAAISTFLGSATGYITTLYDQSGNGRNLTQPNASGQPTILLSGINSKPVIYITPGQTIYNTTNFPAPFTVTYAAKQLGNTGRGRLLTDYTSSSNWLLGWWNGSKGQAYFRGWVSGAGGNASDNNPYVYTGTGTGSISSLFQNGTQLYSNNGGVTGPSGISMGSMSCCSNETSTAYFTDLFIYNSVLSTNDRLSLENSTGSYYDIFNSYPTTAVITVSPSTSTAYSVTGTSAAGCTAQTSYTVNVNPLPTATIGGNATICKNAASPTITFTGANGTAPYTFTYKINNGASQTITTTSGNSVTVSAPTITAGTFIYSLVSVQESSSTACTNTISGTATILVNPLPTASINGTIAVCKDASAPSITFIGAGATAPYTFTYTINGGAAQTVVSTGNTATVSVPTSVAGVYTYDLVSVKDASSTLCANSASGSATVTVNSPSASTTVIKVPFGATYVFNGVTYSATGIYVAHLTNAVGCDSIATLDFTVDPKPSAGADQTVACGSTTKTVTLTGTLPTIGVWSSMAGNDPTATIGTNTNGVVEITLPVAPFTGKLSYVYTTFGGKDTVDIYMTGPTSPVINVNAGSPIICSGSTVQLCPQTWGFSNYQWYKDGYAVAGATGTSSCITVDATGIGSYTLAGTNGAGCWSVPSAPQVVSTTNTLTKPTISVSGSNTLCNGGSVTLTSSSATGNLWFKNGNSTGAITPSITVTEPGDYSVLVSTGTCTSAMSLTTTIAGGVKAGFITANATNNCDSTFSFTSTSANTTSTWNFGDGTTATGNSVTHKYSTVALFTVQQAVISAGGCKDTAVQTVTIVSCPPPPAPTTCNITPGFNIINNTVNGGSYTYISTSTITNGNMTYFWDLGNGTTSTLISPSVTYATAGAYQVKLVVTGNLGCKDSITQSVVVTIAAPPVTPPTCTAPVADFTINNATQCLTGNAFSFSNTSTGTAPTYTWTFGNGSAAVTTTAAAYSYTTANTYTVTLIATNSCGSHQVTKTVTVATAPAMPSSISGSTSITAGATTTLSSATTGGVWSSSNTAVATVDANGVVTAIAAGTTTISYTVSNSCGATATTLSITVTAVVPPVTPPVPPVCTAPVADFTINNATQCLTGNAFSFTNSSTGTTPSYTWTFGDGSAAMTTTNATYSYTAANTYTVTLVATNACGSNQVSKTVTVATSPATPSGISGATTITAGTTSNYSSATAGGVWTSSNTAVATVDANTGAVTAVAAGTTTISYTVSNSCGTTATSLSITVAAAVPPVVVPPTPAPCNLQASFSVNTLSQCVNGNQYVFTNTTTGGTAPFTYLWDLNDGTTATTANVTKTYANYGDRDVTMMVTDANGCTSHAATTQIHVGAQPRAGFSILTHTGNGQSTTFISSSTIAAGNMTYLWDLGNGQTSTLVNPTTAYTPGNYTVKLVVSGIGTCKDSLIQSIAELAIASVKVYPNPVMDVIQVSFVSASATPTTFKLMDLAGRTLQVQTVTPSSRGVNVLATMNTRGLQSGSYVLYISDEQNGLLATKAILKQ